MSDVFVSYKAEDQRRVRPLVDALEADGLSVWWDAEIGGGAAWRQSIEAELDAARCVIVIWSKRSVGAPGAFVHDEATRAMERGIYLPVKIDNARPPLGFGERQALPLTRWQGNRSDPRYVTLLQAVRAIIDGRVPQPHLAGAGPGIDRRLLLAGGAVAALGGGTAAWWLLGRGSPSADSSIAVLPFANLSGDPAQAYFSDGMAEELRVALSRIAGLRVVARTSSEAVGDVDAKAAAAKLGVSHILTGSVRRSPAMIRVSAQLIEGSKGLERWTENYDRPAGDALQIQTDIANRVADALSIRLGDVDRRRIAEGATSNPEAHDLLLKAEAEVRHGEGRQSWDRGIGMVDAALALDPGYADALVAKAWMLKVVGGAYTPTAREARQIYGTADATVRRALVLAPRSRRGHAVLAEIFSEQLRPREALAQFQRMSALPGEDANALRSYAIFLGENLRTDEAMRLIDRAIAIDPLNPQNFGWKAYIEAAARHYPDAIASVRRAIELAPRRKQSRARLGYYLTLAGKYDEAWKEFDRAGNDLGTGLAYKGVLAARTGRKAEAEQILGQLSGNDFANFQVAELLAQMGRKDEAIAALERAWINRDSGLTMMRADPLLDPLRDDPRFEEIVRRIDFPA